MPLGDKPLVVEPSYPYAAFIHELEGKMRDEKEEEADEDSGWRIRNKWFSHSKRSDVYVMEKNGQIKAGIDPRANHVAIEMFTMVCSDAWGVEQEANALQLLAGMIRHQHFKRYLLSGMFLERSTRSGIMYIFRKLRPTIALKARPGLPELPEGHGVEMLAALCMHPIAYYSGTWAGAMCPTDDVIAHLTLMRGDEKMFWKRCNQHPLHRPEAGL